MAMKKQMEIHVYLSRFIAIVNMDHKKAIQHLKKDPFMKRIIKDITYLKLRQSGNTFNELVKAIAYQQISYKAADTIYGRFLHLVGGEFFSPDDVLLLEADEMRAIGFSRQKASYARNIATFFKENDLFTYDWSQLSDDEIIKLLTQIKGVGEWTVQMMLIFELRREDVFPVKDLGIQQAMMGVYDFRLEKKALHNKMVEISEPWRPYRTCLLYTSPSPRDATLSRMPSSA